MNTTTKADDATPAPGTGPQPPIYQGSCFGGQQGWVCPRCGAANAPWVARCACCPPAPPSYPPCDPWYPVNPTPTPFWPPYPGWPTITCCTGGRC